MISNDELIVNIIQIQQKLDDQVLETLPQKEIIPQAIEKIKKDQKKFKEKIIQEIIKEKESLDQEIKVCSFYSLFSTGKIGLLNLLKI